MMLLLAACSGDAVTTTTSSAPVDAPPTTTTPLAPTSTLLPTIEACPEVPYRPLVVPDRVAGEDTEAAELGDDPYSTIPGTSIKIWVGEDSEPVMALIRGSLPPEPWDGPTARIDLLRQDAALGPLPGERWAVAWFESEDRCDLYTLLLYPPTSAAEALEVAESLIPDR
jgi:hypothetical protein